jgi:hypothetical protein
MRASWLHLTGQNNSRTQLFKPVSFLVTSGCNATPRHATPRHATPRHATQCNATQRNATQRNATQRNATQRNATQRNATQQQRKPVIKVDGRNAPRKPSNALDRPLDLALAQRLAPLALAVLVIANLRAQTAAACAREQRLGTTMSAFWTRTAHGDHTHPSIAQGRNTE